MINISLYDNVPFIFKCYDDQQDSKDIVKSTEQGNHLKCFFPICLLRLLLLGVSYFYFCFFFFIFFILFVVVVQNCMTLSQRFSYEAVAFYTEQRTTPLLFHYFEVSQVLSQIEAFFAGLLV